MVFCCLKKCFPGDRAYEVIGNLYKGLTYFFLPQREIMQNEAGIFPVSKGVFSPYQGGYFPRIDGLVYPLPYRRFRWV